MPIEAPTASQLDRKVKDKPSDVIVVKRRHVELGDKRYRGMTSARR